MRVPGMLRHLIHLRIQGPSGGAMRQGVGPEPLPVRALQQVDPDEMVLLDTLPPRISRHVAHGINPASKAPLQKLQMRADHAIERTGIESRAIAGTSSTD
jgi:hypothetical protein